MMIPTVFTAACLLVLAPQQGSISLAPLSKTEEISGCGFNCSLVGIRGVEDAQIFGSDKTLDKSNRIYGFIRVNGRLQKLQRGSRTQLPKRKHQVHVGDKFIETWSNEAVQIRFECTITGTNDEGDGFNGKMIVRLGNTSQVFQIDGGEGC